MYKKLSLTFLAATIFFLILGYFLVAKAKTQVPLPLPYVPCNDVKAPEYHSLRPYQASPCNPRVEETTVSCGNDLIVKETFELTPENTGNPNCETTIQRNITVGIDLSDSELPIAGNTELVPNMINNANPQPEEYLGDPTRVNEYVDWYLNGTIGRAEEQRPNVDLRPEDSDKIVNYSGVLKRLLPEKIQRVLRIKQIFSIGSQRHNQIVGCVTWPTGDVVPCNFISIAQGIIGGHVPVRLFEFLLNPPPFEENYLNFSNFWTDFKRWMGYSCIELPIGGRVCIDNPLKPNYWAQLFFQIPFSSTEDRLGEAEADLSQTDQPTKDEGNDAEIRNISFSPNPKKDLLFFPHMQENAELADILQKTFISIDIKPQVNTPPNAVYNTHRCEVFNARNNAGDDLFGELKPDITGTLSYSAYFNSGCGTKVAMAALSLYTRTPKAEENYDRLVNSPQSVFKRIAPKIGEDGPLTELQDLPAVTRAHYSSTAQQTLAGSPLNDRPGDIADIFIPHLGSIHEYFLKGIQKILRPQGISQEFEGGTTLPGQCSLGLPPYCSVDNLKKYFGSESVAKNASQICHKESGSDPSVVNDGCLRGTTYDYSIGLFQINMLAHPNISTMDPELRSKLDSEGYKGLSCYDAFSKNRPNCSVIAGRQKLASICREWFKDPIHNIEEAVRIWKASGNNFSAWSTAKLCGIK